MGDYSSCLISKPGVRTRKYPVFNAQEERELWVLFKQGSTKAQNLLITSQIPLVINLVTKFCKKYEIIDRGEFDSVAILGYNSDGRGGLYRVLNSFDPDKGRLTTLVSVVVPRALYDYYNTRNQIIVVPHLGRKVKRESVRRMRLKAAFVIGGLGSHRIPQNSTNLSNPSKRTSDVKDEHPSHLEEHLTNMHQEGQMSGLTMALQQLAPRERYIIYKHYWEGKSAQVIGKEQGVSRERIRQIIIRAVDKLRKQLANNKYFKGEIPCMEEEQTL